MQQANHSNVPSLDKNLDVWFSKQEVFIHKLKSQDIDSFKILYNQYAPAILGNILRLVDHNSANMILEETFNQVWFSISTYDESKMKMFTWLNQIARKCCREITV